MTKNVSKQEIEAAYRIAKFLDIDLKICSRKIDFGYFIEPNKVVTSSKTTSEEFWSELFHEFAHAYCYENNIYPLFHKDVMPYMQRISYAIMFGYKIEKYVDRLGAKLMSIFLPDMRYSYWYRTKLGEASHYIWLADDLDGKEWAKFKKDAEFKYGKYRKQLETK